MSEYPIFILILGIIGTITGGFALLISGITYWREKPHLKAKVTGCFYTFTLSKTQVKYITLWSHINIRNLGDRGTRINDIGLSFKVDDKEYHLKTAVFRNIKGESRSGWLEAHDNTDIEADFYAKYEGVEKDRLDCVFTIYHTHNPYKIKAISGKVNELPNAFPTIEDS